MATPHHRSIAQLGGMDPEQGQTICLPEGVGSGYWVGCPSVLYEPDRGRFLMCYRERRPRGHEQDRGWRCAIAESADGVSFRDIWEVRKDELGTTSMERFSLLADPACGYLLYLSYVDPADNRWRIDVVSADGPDAFKVVDAGAALTAESTGTEGVKDPYTLRVGSAVFLFASYARPNGLDGAPREVAHASADIYATGLTDHPTGLAISGDGRAFSWQPDVLRVGSSWDSWAARLTTVLPTGDGFLGLYDGASGVEGNYEERTGLAISFDLRDWTRLTPGQPLFKSNHATGSLRYADAVPVDDEWFIYYEYANPDGSHELRLSRISRM